MNLSSAKGTRSAAHRTGGELFYLNISAIIVIQKNKITGLKTSTLPPHKNAWAIPDNNSVVRCSQNPGYLLKAWKHNGCW